MITNKRKTMHTYTIYFFYGTDCRCDWTGEAVRAWLLISPRIPPSAVVGHVVPVICCRRENFFPKTFPYYEN